MSVETDLRHHFTDQEWPMVQLFEHGASGEMYDKLQDMPLADRLDVVERWRGLVAEWEAAHAREKDSQ